MRSSLITSAAALALAVGGCMTAPPVPAGSGLAATQWTLIDLSEPAAAPVRSVPLGTYTLSFGADGRAAFKLDCNRGTASWSAAAEGSGARTGTLTIGPVASTRAMCPDGGQGSRLASNLGGTWPYTINDGKLTVRTAAGTYTFDSIA